MEHLEGEQYSQYPMEGNSRGYMSMRDYRNLQNQQPWERNPNPPRSMRDYRDQWMSAPSYMVPPQYASLSQPQPPQPISPVEQAILDLTKLVGDAVGEQKKFNAQLSQKIYTVENPLEQTLDGFQSELGQQFDSLQCSISKLAQQLDHKGEENPEDEWTGTILGEQVQLQPQEELKMESVEAPEELQDAPESGVNFWPWIKEEQISALITEKGSGIEAGKEPQKLILQPIPLKLNPTATAQATKCPLPVTPSTDQVYILPSPASQPTSEAPAPKGKSNPSLHAMQNFKRLVASVHKFATTSKAQAAAYTAWHSGWFGCRFKFGASNARHF